MNDDTGHIDDDRLKPDAPNAKPKRKLTGTLEERRQAFAALSERWKKLMDGPGGATFARGGIW